MSRKNLLIVIIGTLVVAGVGLGIYFALPHPTHLSGDAWDYAIRPNEVPQGWRIKSQGVITPHDLAQESVESNLPIDQSVSLANMTHMYYSKYEPPELSEYLDLTQEVIVYKDIDSATAAFAPENPGEGWEAMAVTGLGDETHAWRFLKPDPTISQNIFRIDFRFLNAIASVTMIGTEEILPNVNEPLSYARKIQQKMLNFARPRELKRLEQALLPDLRAVLLSQDQIAQNDDYLGRRWQVDSRLVPGWTPTTQFDTDTQPALERLGRVTGYQMFLIKALGTEERPKSIPAGLFQQVTVYGQADAAKEALGYMVGIEKLQEQPTAPKVGDQARVWGGLLETTNADGSKTTITVHEIDFRVGRYIASIRLQSRPLTDAEHTTGQVDNLNLALKLALALAANLKAQGGG